MDSSLEQLRRELKEALGTASPSDLNQGPEGKWSASQILEHLWLTYSHTNRGIAKCLQAAKPLASRPTLKNRVQTFAVVTMKYFPSGREAPERAAPRGKPSEELLRVIFPEIEQMSSGFAECERKFGAGTKILDHPVLGPLTADEWRTVHWLHGRHHARQIRERLAAS